MADSERPSPFTIPQPAFQFESASTEERPPRSMTVGGLIHNLTVFADFHERASADIDRVEGVMKPWHIGNRDANADVMQRDFRATVAIDRVRAYVMAKYSADLTIGTARRLLGDLIKTCDLAVDAAEALPLEVAMDKLASPPAAAPESVPLCPGCGSPPAATDVDDICPSCGAYTFLCGAIEHVPLGDTPIITQQVAKPRWKRIPPSQTKAKQPRDGLTTYRTDPEAPAPVVVQAEATTAAAPGSNASLALMRVFTNGIADDRIGKATRLLADNKLTVNEKLTNIDDLIRLPPTASAEQLGEMLGVTKQGVLKTDWWMRNRKGEKKSEVGRRRDGHRKRAKSHETPGPDKDDE
jgi:hypothetical protein